jgi:hypothetical protein
MIGGFLYPAGQKGVTMKTKFLILIILLSLIAALLVGCGSPVTTVVSASNGLSPATKLALGILKLEGTSDAVTASQASQLLTLWEGYESISTSDTTSQVELDALVQQIESTMTETQIKAIDAMQLNDQSVNEVLSSFNTANSLGTPSSTPNSSAFSPSTSSGGQSGVPSGGSGAMPSGSSGGMPSKALGGMAPGGDSSGVSEVLNGVAAQSTQATSQSSA